MCTSALRQFLISQIMLAFLFYTGALFAAEPITDSQNKITIIKVGKTGSESGQDAPIGKNMTLGIKIYFDKINAKGGLNGKQLQLIALDDGYVPQKAGENARKLINTDQVIALIGDNGSPTTVVVVPIMSEYKTLLFAPFTGASFLYQHLRYVIPLRPSYASEVKEMIKELMLAGIKPEEIVFFTQNDAFGDSVHQGGVDALKAAGFTDADKSPHGRYTRNTLNVEDALVTIIDQAKTPPKAFIMGGVASANAKFAKLAEKQYPNAIFLAVSGFFSAKDFGKEENGKIISTQVVPHYNSDLPITKEYLADLKKYGNGAEPGFTSLQGYIAGKVFVLGLQNAISKNQLNREGLINAFDNMNNVDIGIGVNIHLNSTHEPGLNKVWATILENGQFVPLDWTKLKTIIKH